MSSNEITELLDDLYFRLKMQLGDLVKSRWVYDGDGCPGCRSKISTMKFKKRNALSVNTFIFDEHGVLIAYLLCGKCARHIFKESETNPHGNRAIHDENEKNLKQAYLKKLGH